MQLIIRRETPYVLPIWLMNEIQIDCYHFGKKNKKKVKAAIIDF